MSDVRWRPAARADRQALQQFTCCPDTDHPRKSDCEQPWAHEVQGYLRQKALPFCLRNPASRDQRLLLVEDGPALVGAAVHALTDVDEPQGVRDRAIVVYAVALDCQGKQLSDGRRASHAVLDAVVEDAVSRHEQGVRIVMNARSTRETSPPAPACAATDFCLGAAMSPESSSFTPRGSAEPSTGDRLRRQSASTRLWNPAALDAPSTADSLMWSRPCGCR